MAPPVSLRCCAWDYCLVRHWLCSLTASWLSHSTMKDSSFPRQFPFWMVKTLQGLRKETFRRGWGGLKGMKGSFSATEWNLCARGVFQRDVRAQHLFACCTSPANARPSMLAEPRSWAGLLAEEEEGKMVPSCCVSGYMAFLPARAESMKVITTLAFAW